MCPPLGAVAVLLFAAPAAVPSKPYNTAMGFLVGSAAAFAVYSLVGDSFLKDFGGTRALMVGFTIAAMKITNSVHPPAGNFKLETSIPCTRQWWRNLHSMPDTLYAKLDLIN